MSDYVAGKITPLDDYSAILSRLDQIEATQQQILSILITKQEQDKTLTRPPVDFEKVKRPKEQLIESEWLGQVERVTPSKTHYKSALSGELFPEGAYYVILYHNEWTVNNFGFPRSYSTKTYANAFILLDEAIEIQHPEASVMLAAKKEKYESSNQTR